MADPTVPLGLLLASFLIVAAFAILVHILFLLTLYRALQRVSHSNRAMSPGLVWLNLVPFLSLGWFIYTVMKVRDSLQAEHRSRGLRVQGDFGYNIGLAAGVLFVIITVWYVLQTQLFADSYAAVTFVLEFGYLVCWIIYWVRIARFKNQLTQPGAWISDDWQHPAPPGSEGPGRHCDVCGTQVGPDDKFCHVCGSRLE